MLTRYPILILLLILVVTTLLNVPDRVLNRALNLNLALDLALAGPQPDALCHIPVIRVVDGDTLVVRINGRTERIRLLNVDTPESVHPDKQRNSPRGKAASAYTRSRLEGQTVCLEFEQKKRGNYGRLLAYVILDDKNFNLELVRQGWSPYYTKYGSSLRYDREFTKAQEKARSQGKGLWALNAPDRPLPGSRHAARALSPGNNSLFSGNIQSHIFHRTGCRWFNCSQCTQSFSTRKKAIDSGYRPCSLCRP